MDDVVFIGDHHDAALFRDAGIPSYAPPIGHLAERVLAERCRCRVLAMKEDTLRALPESLARELREGPWPQLEIVPDETCRNAPSRVMQSLRRHKAAVRAAVA